MFTKATSLALHIKSESTNMNEAALSSLATAEVDCVVTEKKKLYPAGKIMHIEHPRGIDLQDGGSAQNLNDTEELVISFHKNHHPTFSSIRISSNMFKVHLPSTYLRLISKLKDSVRNKALVSGAPISPLQDASAPMDPVSRPTKKQRISSSTSSSISSSSFSPVSSLQSLSFHSSSTSSLTETMEHQYSAGKISCASEFPSDIWPCPVCTFHNSVLLSTCEICQVARYSSASSNTSTGQHSMFQLKM
jgi:hypothetical protein